MSRPIRSTLTGSCHLRDVVRGAAHEGTVVLVCSHHLDEVARVADRVEVIHRGRMLGELSRNLSDLEHAFVEMVHSADNMATGPATCGESS